jgi:tRNA dimethylallyltransferase
MHSRNEEKSLIVIVGPTAVGKTEVSLTLAEQMNGEIISADSRLLYRGMDIGTAKPTPEEMARVRHHLVNVADPDENWGLAKYQRAANAAIDEILQRDRLPFLVGGSGQYIKAVIEGWKIPEVRPDHRLRRALRNWSEEIGSDELFDRLAHLDPAAADRIDPQNVRRSIRALEVIFHTGKLFSSQKQREEIPYRVVILGIIRSREELYRRIDARIQTMISQGFIDEVRHLLDQGYSPDIPSLSAIGYRQIIDYLKGEISLDEAVIQMERLTRQYVRRQANWFKIDDPNIHWFRPGPSLIEELKEIIAKHLKS